MGHLLDNLAAFSLVTLRASLSCTGLSLLCERIGPAVFSKVIRGALHHSLRFGYVQMQTAEAAQRVV